MCHERDTRDNRQTGGRHDNSVKIAFYVGIGRDKRAITSHNIRPLERLGYTICLNRSIGIPTKADKIN